PSAQLRREVLGFAPYWNLGHYAEWNYSLMSTVAYFGLTVNLDGTFATQGGGWDGWNSSDLTNMINSAHAAGARVVLVIKNFNDNTINRIVTTSAGQTLITQTINAVTSKNMDGVNVDFEGSGSALFPDIPAGITNFMAQLSSAMHAKWPQSQVSIDTFSGSASWDGGIFRIGDLAPVVDAFFIMAYDSVFENMPGQAGPNSPLNGWTFNSTVDVAQYLTKAPASKIILGVPYYGYKWRTVDGSPNSSTASGGVAESYSGVLNDLSCGHVAMKNGWDGVGQSPYAAWWSPKVNDPCGDNLSSPQELYYDNAASLGLKYDLVNANNLRGTGMWALGYDTGTNDLWNELAVKFTTTTPWYSLGGTATSGPHPSSWSATRTDVFVRGAVMTTDAAADAWGTNGVDVFARGTGLARLRESLDTPGWHGWEGLGGYLTSAPAVASCASGHLDVFVIGGDSAAYQIGYAGTWAAWQRLGGHWNLNPGAVCSIGTNTVSLFAEGPDTGVWWTSIPAS